MSAKQLSTIQLHSRRRCWRMAGVIGWMSSLPSESTPYDRAQANNVLTMIAPTGPRLDATAGDVVRKRRSKSSACRRGPKEHSKMSSVLTLGPK